jgi:hypothetical protein
VQTNFKITEPNISTIKINMNDFLVLDSVLFRVASLPLFSNISILNNIVTINLNTAIVNNYIDSFTIYEAVIPTCIVVADNANIFSNSIT